MMANSIRQAITAKFIFAAGSRFDRGDGLMVGTPIRRHRRTAAIRAQRAIAEVSPIRESERRVERRRLIRNRNRRARAAILRGMREVLGLPQLVRQRRVPPPRDLTPACQ